MDKIYEKVLELYDYDKIDIKNKYILVDMGGIGNNCYHCQITDDTIEFYNLDGRTVGAHSYYNIEQIESIMETFKEGADKKPITDDGTFNELSLDDIVLPVVMNIMKPSKDKIKIYTYGHRNYNPSSLNMEYSFDVSKYCSSIPASFGSLRYLTGRDEIVQKFVAMGEEFEPTLRGMVIQIEKKGYNTIGIFCAHGKHRSVSFAEILKMYFYKRAIMNHLCIRT